MDYDDNGAFGNPDGSREEFDRFVILESGGLTHTNPSYIESSIKHRVIVGAKGAGKTLYMRKMKSLALENESIAVIKEPNHIPSTETILDVHKTHEDNIRTETWQLIWRRSIFLSVASQFYAQYSKDIVLDFEPSIDREEFLDTFKQLICSKMTTPQSIFSQLGAIVTKHGQSPRRLKGYLDDPEWDSFEKILIEIINNSPPIVYFIDALDEEFRHGPSAWLDLQKGLFYQVMRLLRDSELGGRLHIIICIRDLVYSSVLQSEHGARYIGDEHIKILHWSRSAAKEFLNKKIKMLSNIYFIDSNKERNLENLIGFKSIKNKKRRVEESVDDYILRHTKYFPRDIINIGNQICKEIELTGGRGSGLEADRLSASVSTISSIIAQESITICGNHLAVSSLPNHALKQEVIEQYLENEIISDTLKEIVFEFVRTIGKDQFDRPELDAALAVFQTPIDEHAEKNKFEQYRIDTVLWQHGLIGYKNGVRDKVARFKNSSPLEPYSLPIDKPRYVLHSCLHDAVKIDFKRGTPIVCE